MKRKAMIGALILIILIGIGCILYPLVSNYLYEKQQDIIITEYTEVIEDTDSELLAEALAAAQAYNEKLLTSTAVLTDPFDPDAFQTDDEEYASLLNLSGDGIMGYIEIPKIDVLLPIYHGTSDAVLEQGIGHLQNSSLPVGGAGTHAVLSGHTGLADKRLFTDLTELEEGDYFYITVLGETLVYQVDLISVVEPYDTSLLQIESDQDYVTLLTCTPYGVNDHRLLVRGVRTIVESDDSDETTLVIADDSDDGTYSSQWLEEYKRSVKIGLACVAGTLAVLIAADYVWSHRYRGRRMRG